MEGATNEPLDVVDGVGRVQHGLVLGPVPDEPALRGEGHHRRGDTVALLVLDDLDLAVFVDPDAAVGRPEINPDRGSLYAAMSAHGVDVGGAHTLIVPAAFFVSSFSDENHPALVMITRDANRATRNILLDIMTGPLDTIERAVGGDVEFALVIGACPTISMLICSYCFFGRDVSVTVEAMFQKFAAGMILTAVAMELFPALEQKVCARELHQFFFKYGQRGSDGACGSGTRYTGNHGDDDRFRGGSGAGVRHGPLG